MERRLRFEKRRLSFFMDIIMRWERRDSESMLNWYMQFYSHKINEDYDIFKNSIEDYIVNTLQKKYENRIKTKHSTLEQIEEDIWNDSIFINVENRLFSFLDIWEKKYPFSIPNNTELKKLTDDSQNVHTRVINRQTRQYTEIIKNINVPKGQKTIDEIITAWLSDLKLPWSEISNVFIDMNEWGSKATIFSESDYMYRKMIRSLWALIKTKTGEIYLEILKRLWEECLESVGMCGQGHISRLANVLSGFDSNFISSVSIMERFREQISDISNKDMSIDNKIKEANFIMDEIDMPLEERQNWIEAF
jgi:hypothetical protein